MPCECEGYETYDETQRKDHDMATKIACYYLQRYPVPYWAQAWWEKHQELDRQRAEAEEAAKNADVFIRMTKKEYDEYIERQIRD